MKQRYRTDRATSARMRQVRTSGTIAERAVRRLLFARGYRYRISYADLPGCPDIVFPKRRKVIFVHGCFWHRHSGCPRTTMPVRNAREWTKKFQRNVERDAENVQELEATGWSVLIVWECQIKDVARLERRLQRFLEKPSALA